MSWRWTLISALCASFLTSFVVVGTKADVQVLIIGGGPAAIQAAATLEENGIDDYLILEASDELRGYLKSIEFGGITVAPGYVWGYTPIKERLEDLDVDHQETNYGSFTAYNSSGHDITEEFNETENAFYGVLYDELGEDPIIEDIDQGYLPDLPQKAALARYGWIARTPQEKLAEWLNVDWCEGISGRHISTIQSWRLTNSELYPDEYLITDDRTLFYPLLGDQEDAIEEDKVVYNAKVVHVDYTDDYVEVTTEEGDTYVGNYTIITSTVGVIQNGRIAFTPPLPPWMAEQYSRYQMAVNEQFFLKFDNKFWNDTEYIYFASEYAGYYPVFVNLEVEGLRPAGTNILMGFLTGETVYRVEHLSDEEIIAEILEVLETIYDDVPEPTEFYMTRSATNDDLYGSYTTWPIGINPADAEERLKGSIGDGRLFFAPEDAGDDYQGIPFASKRNGIAAAEGVAGCINNGECEDYEPVDDTCPKRRPKKYRKQNK